jgi:hypothetical protein
LKRRNHCSAEPVFAGVKLSFWLVHVVLNLFSRQWNSAARSGGSWFFDWLNKDSVSVSAFA